MSWLVRAVAPGNRHQVVRLKLNPRAPEGWSRTVRPADAFYDTHQTPETMGVSAEEMRDAKEDRCCMKKKPTLLPTMLLKMLSKMLMMCAPDALGAWLRFGL